MKFSLYCRTMTKECFIEENRLWGLLSSSPITSNVQICIRNLLKNCRNSKSRSKALELFVVAKIYFTPKFCS